MKYSKFSTLIKDYLPFILFLPIFLNFFLNITFESYSNGIYFNFSNLISTLMLFIFLLTIGKAMKESLKIENLSFGITIYLISFFMFDSYILLVSKNLSFQQNFYVVMFLWFVFFIFKKVDNVLLISIFILFFLNIVINRHYGYSFDKNTNIEVDVWYYIEFSKNIFENNYFYSMNNNIFAGYSQFSSYIQTILHSLSFIELDYNYYRSTSNVLFFLLCLVIFESTKDSNMRIFAISLFSSLTLNSNWLEFLFFDSLMSEGILNFLFTSATIAIFNEKNKKLSFFIFGVLIFSKQFYIVLVLITGLMFILLKKYRKFAPYIFIGIATKELIYLTYFKNLEKDHHIRQIDILDTILDLILLRDLNLYNFIEILKNLFIDKPFSYLIVLMIGLYIFNLIKNQSSFEINYFGLIIFLNFLLIVLLYISAWRQMELESPIRFILNLFTLKIIFVTKNLELLKNTIKS